MNRQGEQRRHDEIEGKAPFTVSASYLPEKINKQKRKGKRHKTCCLRFANRFSDFLDVKQIDNIREEILLRKFK